MTEFFNEAMEEFNRNKKTQQVKKILPYILVVMIITIFLVAIFAWWKNYNQNKTYQEGSDYLFYLYKVEANPKEAAKGFLNVYNNGTSEYAALAGMKAFLLDNNRTDILKTIKQNNSYSDAIQEFAMLQEIALKINQNSITEAELESLVQQTMIFKEQALVFQVLYLIGNKNIEAAKQTLTSIPQSSRMFRTLEIAIAQNNIN